MAASTSDVGLAGRSWSALIAIWTAVLLSGCAALAVSSSADLLYSAAFRISIENVTKLSPEELQEARSILFFASEEGLEASDKGQMAGLACKLSVAPLIPKFFWYPPLSEELAPTPADAARLQLKIKAMRAGANAVIAPTCIHHEGVDWVNDCFDSWVCKGRAVWVR